MASRTLLTAEDQFLHRTRTLNHYTREYAVELSDGPLTKPTLDSILNLLDHPDTYLEGMLRLEAVGQAEWKDNHWRLSLRSETH